MLNKDGLKAKIKNAFQKAQTEERSADKALDDISEALAKAIVEEILSLTVSVNPGIAVTTPAGPGLTSGIGTTTLS